MRPTRARRAARAAAARVLGVAAAACLAAPACAPQAPPRNLVLISIDTLVPGRMSAYGGPRPTTPAIDALLDRGVRFDNAFTPAPWTLPAHVSMLSGRYPSSISADPNDKRLFHGAPLLSEAFRRAGHRTVAVTGGGYVSKDFGADRGFERFEWAGPRAAVRFIDAHSHEPFFLFFHTYAPHAPYRSRRFADGLDPGRYGDIYTEGHARLHTDVCCNGSELTEAEKAFVLALYDGGVAAADEMVAQIVAALERNDLLGSTAVVITSDHGEEFWEHTGRGAYHGHSLYDELLRVPLLWIEPGIAQAGQSVGAPVSLIDIAPTVMARFGLERAGEVDGVDLSPLLDGGAFEVDRALFAEAVAHGPARVSVRTARGKLIETPEPDAQRGEGAWFPVPVRAPREVYAHDDRDERHNLAGERPVLLGELAAALAGHRARAADAQLEGDVELDDATRDRLEALGYTE